MDSYLLHPAEECYDYMEQMKDELERLVHLGQLKNIDQLRVSIVKKCKSEEHVTDIIEFFDALRRKGLGYGLYSSSILLQQMGKFKMVEVAQRFFVRMIRSGFGFKPDIWTYTPIINMLCWHAMVRVAESYFSQLLKLGFCPDAHVFTSLILGYGRRKDIISMFRVSKEMVNQGIPLNGLTYIHLICGLCHAGRVDEAVEMLKTSIGEGIKPTVRTFTLPISSLCEEKQAMKDLDLVVLMRNRGCLPNVETYSPLIGGLFIIDQPKLAIGFYHQMARTRMIPPMTRTCNALLHGLSTMRMFDAAFMIFDWMEGYGHLSNTKTYNEIIRIWCLIRNPKKGIVLFNKMANEEGLEPDESTYSILIPGFCRAGCLDEVGSYFYKVAKGKRKLMPKKYHYISIIDAYFKQGRVEAILRLLKDGGCSPKAYGAIIFCFLERCLSSEAVEVFKMMKDAPYGVDYKELVGWLRQYGDMNHVKMMFCNLWKMGMEDDDLRSLEEGIIGNSHKIKM